jgi:hypothetical protein
MKRNIVVTDVRREALEALRKEPLSVLSLEEKTLRHGRCKRSRTNEMEEAFCVYISCIYATLILLRRYIKLNKGLKAVMRERVLKSTTVFIEYNFSERNAIVLGINGC